MQKPRRLPLAGAPESVVDIGATLDERSDEPHKRGRLMTLEEEPKGSKVPDYRVFRVSTLEIVIMALIVGHLGPYACGGIWKSLKLWETPILRESELCRKGGDRT